MASMLPWFAASYRLTTYRKVIQGTGWQTVLYLFLRDGRRIRYHMTTDDLRQLIIDARHQLRQRQRSAQL